MKQLSKIILLALFISSATMLTSCVCGDAIVENVDAYYKLAKPVEVDPILTVSGKTISHKRFGTFDINEMEYDKLYENADKDATLEFKQQGEGKDDYCVITEKGTNNKYYFEFLVHGGRRKSFALGLTW